MTIDEASDRMKQATLEASELYCKHNNLEKIDRQHWIFLHLRFMSALKLCGYTEEEVSQIQDETCKKLDLK